MPPKPPSKPGSANQGDKPGVQQLITGAQPASAVQQTAGQARTPTGPPPASFVAAKPVAERAGQAPTGGGLQMAGQPPGALEAGKSVQERTGKAPVGTAVAGQTPKAAKAPVQAPVAARAGQAPMAARAGQAQTASAGQSPSAARAGAQGAAPSPSAPMAGQGPGVAGAIGAGVARGGPGFRPSPGRGGAAGPPGRGGMGGPPGAGGPLTRGWIGTPGKDGAAGPPGQGGMASAPDGAGGPQAIGGMAGPPGRGKTAGRGAKGGAAGPSGIHSPGTAGAGGGASPSEAGEQGSIPDSAGEPSTTAEKINATYNHHRVYHWTNPFIVRATETVLATVIVAALIIADLPLKKTVWIHFNFASPTIPIAAMFGVAALYHRNPLDKIFTLILLGFCLVCYICSLSQVLTRWNEIKRNRAQRPAIWVTILELNAVLILTLLVDIIWYVCYLFGCPCFVVLRKIFPGKKGDASKKKDGKKKNNKKQEDGASVAT